MADEQDQEDQGTPAGGNTRDVPFPGMGTPIPSAPVAQMPVVDTNHRNFDAGGQSTPIIDPPPQQPSAQVNTPVAQPQQPPTSDHELWEGLNKTRLYTDSYEDFKKQFNNPASIDELYKGLNEAKLYTDSKEDFYNQYFQHLPSKEITDAHDFISNALNSPLANKAVDKLTEDQFYNGLRQQQSSQGKDATRIQQPLPVRLADQTKADRDNFNAQAANNPNMVRSVISEMKRQNITNTPYWTKPIKDENLNKNLDKALATIDVTSRPHDPAELKHNLEQIDAGNIHYNGVTRQFEKPTNPITSIVNAFKNHSTTIDNYNYVTSHSKEDNVKYLDDLDKNYNPDKPVPVAEGYLGLSSFGDMLGSNAVGIAKMGAGGAAATLAGSEAATGGLALPVAAIATLGMGMGVQDFHHTSYFNTLQSMYRELKQQHPDADHNMLYDEAEKQANVSGALSMGQALLMGEVGSKLTKNVKLNPITGGPLKAIKDIGTNILKTAKAVAPDALTQATIASGVKAIENHAQGKPLTEGTGDAFMGTLIMMAGFSALKSPSEFLSNVGRKNIKAAFAQMPEGTIEKIGSLHDAMGTMNPDDIAETKQSLNANKAASADEIDIHAPITKEAAAALRSVEENGIPKLMTPDLEKIARDNGIVPEKSAEGKEKPLTSEDVINKLKNRQSRGGQPETFANTDITSGLSDIMKANYEKDPEAFLKEVADHAHGGVMVDDKFVSSRSGAEKEYGADLVKLATEKYPDHIIAEPKIEPSAEVGQTEDTQDAEKPHHTISTPNIVNIKNKENAIPIEETGSMGVRDGSAIREEVGGANKPVQSTGESGQPEEIQNKNESQGETKPDGSATKSDVGEERTVGVRHESLRKIADRLGLEQPEKGTILSAQEQTERGRALLKAGADPSKVQEDFDNTGKVDADSISVARAHYENLVKNVQAAFDTKGKGSPEYEAAKKVADDWQKEVMKPMGTASGGAFTALQGETDVDTGSFISMSRAFEDKYGKAPNPEQEAKLKEASDKVKELTSKVSDLEQKLTEAIDKNVGTPKEKAVYANKAKAVADAFRKLKTKPFTFKDENGNEINVTKMGVDWNDIVEAGAKIIEKTGEIADGIAAAIEKIKDADWYKGLSDSDKDRFAKQLEAHYNEEAPELAYTDLAEKLAGKKDNKFTPEDAKGIWGYMKDEYLRKGKDFDTSVNGTAVDLGISSEQVRKAITSPKSAKVISDEMYIEQYKEQQAIRDAKGILKTANLSKIERTKVAKFAKALPNVFFALKTFGHGTVGNVTHSGMNIFTPSAWKTYWPNFAKQFKYAFGGTSKEGLAAYQQEMNDLIHHPQFAFWKRNGLAVDPAKSYDDYQQFNKHLKALTEMGDRGFNALKVQRLQLAEHLYNGLSEAAKSDPNTGKEIAKIVNHSTGTADVPVPKAIGTLVFAPRLEASRWARLGEVGKAGKTLYNWSEASEADKAAAKIIVRRNAEIMSTYLAALASNSAVLAIAGSKQKINYTDPTQPDWLKFKGKDQTLDVTGGMLSSLRFLSGLVNASVGEKKKVRGREEARSETIFKNTGKYIRGKLSPFGATALDITSQADYSGRPLPFSSDKGDAFHPKYTWKEYLEEQQLPIPVSEAFKVTHDQMRDRGVPEATASEVLHGVISGAISGGTGARVAIDYANDRKEAKDKKAAATKKPTLPPTQYIH